MKFKLPELHTRAQVRKSSYDKEKRTVDVVFTTGARGLRSGLFSEPYYEELEISPDSVRLDRFNSGSAPVLNSHNQYDLNSVIGVVENARIESGKGIATVRFSDREDVRSIVKDIEDGILRNVSIGYRVYKYQEVQEEGIEHKIFRAVDFEPMELSFVAVPFDSGAQTRSSEDQNECEILSGDKKMEDDIGTMEDDIGTKTEEVAVVEEIKTEEVAVEDTAKTEEEKPADAPATDAQQSAEDLTKRAVAQERKRVSEVFTAIEKAGLNKDVAKSFVERGLNIDEVRKEILNMLEKETNSEQTRSATVEVGKDLARESRLVGCVDAILHRSNSAVHKMTDAGRIFAYSSLLDIAKECVRGANIDIRMMDSNTIVERAFHSTSDFPLILENIVNKELRAGYETTPRTFIPFVRKRSLADFKQVSSAQLGMAPKLLELQENGELQAGTIAEGAEKYALKSFGRKVKVGRRVIINDDLGALTDVPRGLGMQAANLESDLFWIDLIIGNQVMADGIDLFDALHENLAGTGTTIDITNLGVARRSMRLQKDIDGVTPINVNPRFLVVSPQLETLAEQITTSALGNAYSPEQVANVNPFQAKLTPITEVRLQAASAPHAWYVFSSSAEIPMAEWGVLQGQEGGPVTSQYLDAETKGITFDALYDVIFKVVDYRGFYKNPGV